MPWLKSTRYLNGEVHIEFGRRFCSAKECMDSFGRFEKDDSFGRPSCWPVFWPANDEELDLFEEFLRKAQEQETDPTEELAKNLLDLVVKIKEKI